jgi:hypothetical protein
MADPALKFMMFTLVTVNELPLKLMPINPLPTPLMERFRRLTVIPAALMLIPLVSAASTKASRRGLEIEVGRGRSVGKVDRRLADQRLPKGQSNVGSSRLRCQYERRL